MVLPFTTRVGAGLGIFPIMGVGQGQVLVNGFLQDKDVGLELQAKQ